MESNALQTIRLLNGHEDDGTELKNFIREAQSLSSERKVEGFFHVLKRHNHMAHYLAFKACLSGDSISWAHSFPNWLLKLKLADIGGCDTTDGGSCPIDVIPMT